MSGSATLPSADTAEQAALRKALAPTTGMRRLKLPLESYEHPSKPLSIKRLLNMYAEQEPADARTAAALVPTPGLSLHGTYGAGPVWAMNDELPGRIYLVSGTHLFRIRQELSGEVVDDLGDVGAPDTTLIPAYEVMITIACSPMACVVVVPPNAYTCGHNLGDDLNQIGGDFPGAKTVALLDHYFAFTSYENTSQWFISKIADPLAYDALDFAFADSVPNVTSRVIAHNGDLWLLGLNGIEAWYDSGDADFPFRPRPGARIAQGVATGRSVATGDNSVFWLGSDGMVYRSQGYQAKRISTHALEQFLRDQNPRTAESGFTFHERGHTLYAFTLAGHTHVYDCATQLWHDRSSGADGTGRWRPLSCAGRYDIGWFGDATSGQVFVADANNYTDGGVTVARIVVLPPLWAGTYRAFCNRLEVEIDAGPGAGNVTLAWSNDGGYTWPFSRVIGTGADVAARKRMVATRLGSFRQRVFQLTFAGRIGIYAVDADISGGSAG